MNISLEELKRQVIKKKSGPHKIRNSIGAAVVFRHLQHTRWKEVGKALTCSQFCAIIHKMGDKIAEALCKGETIELPCQMGSIMVVKYESNVRMKNGKLRVYKSIDWGSTYKLWHEDEESFKKRTLVRYDDKDWFGFSYDKSKAKFKNKIFFKFKAVHSLKKMLNHNILYCDFDAMTEKLNYHDAKLYKY